MTGTGSAERAPARAGSVFSLVLLVLSGVYLASALRLEFLIADGRPGPGFFPRFVGTALVVTLGYGLWKDFGRAGYTAPPEPRAALAFGALGAGLVAGFFLVGAWPATALYLFVTLSLFGRGRRAANVALGLAVPLLLFLLFEALLGVPLPRGVLFGAR